MQLKLTGKKVAITGGAGFIGSHLVDRLIREDVGSIAVVDNFFLGNIANLEDAVKLFPDLDVIRSDASDFSTMFSLATSRKFDVIFNLAVIPLPTSLTLPMWTVRTNYDIAMAACELCRLGVVETLVQCSSSEAYGTAVSVPMDEEHPLVPCTPYAASKAAEDQLVLSYVNTFAIDALIVRPFNNYGPRQNYREYAGIIPVVIRKVLAGEPIVINGTGHQTRDYVFVEDTVDAIIKSYCCKETRGQALNIGTGTEISVRELVDRVLTVLGKKDHPVVFGKERPGDVMRHCSSTEKAQRLIGYVPRSMNEETLGITVDWYKRRLY